MFYVPQYAPHCIQMWLQWCLHELTHHSNYITQIWPCDGHVIKLPTMRMYIVVSSTRSPSSALSFTFYSHELKWVCNPSSHIRIICSRHIAFVVTISLWGIRLPQCQGSNAILPNPSSQTFASKASSNQRCLHRYLL